MKRSNEELELFAYIVSHELQEPLRMVTNYLQLLEQRYEDQLDVKANKFIRYAREGAIRMKQLIADLLLYSRFTRDKKSLLPVNYQKLLLEVLKNLEIPIMERQAVITHDPLSTVMANGTQLG